MSASGHVTGFVVSVILQLCRHGVAFEDVEEFIQRRASAIATAHAAAVEDDRGGRGHQQQHCTSARAAARMRDLQVGHVTL